MQVILRFRQAYLLVAIVGCALGAVLRAAGQAPEAPAPPAEGNPLLQSGAQPWGYPPFDRLRAEHFEPAFAQGMREQLAEVQAICRDARPPNFENTILSLVRSGQTLDRVARVFDNLVATDSTPELQRIEAALAPLLSRHQDAIFLDAALFSRIEAVRACADQEKLDAVDRRLLERTWREFQRAGARLDAAGQERLRQINTRIAEASTAFGQKILLERGRASVWMESRSELEGLSPEEQAAAQQAARDAGKPEGFLLRLTNTTVQPVLERLANRALRERVWRASMGRGTSGGPYDTTRELRLLAELRSERAALLGYAHHAAYTLEETMAGNAAAVDGLLQRLGPLAVARQREEARALQARIDAEGGGFQLAAWDWDYYGERERAERHAFDEESLRPYFELEGVLQRGVFFAAERLYGLTFCERKDLPVYHPEVRVFEVRQSEGEPCALVVFDFYARPSKQGGAWMHTYVGRSAVLGTRPVLACHLNVPRPAAGEPTLLSLDQVETLFHEFGHALHALLAESRYPRFGFGGGIPADFVELPSQANEMWAYWPEVLRSYARHWQTGAPIPEELMQRAIGAARFNQGYATTEYLAACAIDQAWHRLAPSAPVGTVAEVEAAALRAAGLDLPQVPPRYRSAYFAHVFSGGYSARYYAYIWAEVMDAEAAEWFAARGGLSRESGEHYRRTILAPGADAAPEEMFRAFLGRGPEVGPLLRRRGLEPKEGRSF